MAEHQANLKAKVSLDDSNFMGRISRLEERAKEAGKKAGEAFKEGLEYAGAFKAFELAGDAIKESIKFIPEGIAKAVELGDRLKELNLRTGMSVRNLALWNAALKSVGIEGEIAIGQMVNKLQHALSGLSDTNKSKAVKSVMAGLGLDMDELRKMPIDEVMDIIRQKIGNLKSPTDRAAAAMTLFGRAGGEMLKVFSNPEVWEIAKEGIGKQADVFQKNAENFERIWILYNAIGNKVMGLFVGMAGPIVEVATPLLQMLNKIDLTTQGQMFGNYVRQGIEIIYNAFQSGNLGKLFADSIRYGAEVGVNYLSGAATTFADFMQKAFQGMDWKAVGMGLTEILNGVANSFVGTMLKVLGPLADGMQAVMNWAVNSFDRGLAETFSHIPGLSKYADALAGLGTNKNAGPETADGVKQKRIEDRQAADVAALNKQYNIGPGPGQVGPDDAGAEYAAKHNAIMADQTDPGQSIMGATSDMFLGVAKHQMEEGAGKIIPSIGAVGQAAKDAAAGFKSGSVFDTTKAQKDINDDVKRFGHAIPGEVQPSEEQGNAPGGTGNWNQAALDAMEKGGKGAGSREKELRPIWYRNGGGGTRRTGLGGMHYSMAQAAGVDSWGNPLPGGTTGAIADHHRRGQAAASAAKPQNNIERMLGEIITKMDNLVLS